MVHRNITAGSEIKSIKSTQLKGKIHPINLAASGKQTIESVGRSSTVAPSSKDGIEIQKKKDKLNESNMTYCHKLIPSAIHSC